METKAFLKQLDDRKVSLAISEAEKKTSGEIRVFVSEQPAPDALADAEKQFIKLGMQQTRERNGVLIYFAPLSQSFAVVGDSGVNEKCGAEFWKHLASGMEPLLKNSDFTGAVELSVREIAAVLAKHFPPRADDRNELSNEVARG